MAKYLQRVGEQPSEFLVEEWNLLSVAYKNTVGVRRAAWRVVSSVEQKEKFKGNEQLASHAKVHVAKVEGELQKIRDGILALMDQNLISSACTGALQMFAYLIKCDCCRRLAELKQVRRQRAKPLRTPMCHRLSGNLPKCPRLFPNI